jgi:hypothetical protein
MIFTGVAITFLSAGDAPIECIATVRQTDSEMVIDISANQDRPYLVTGHLVRNFFAGRDEVSDGRSLDIAARWTELGDVWVGWWSEEGVEYLFTFRLPKHPTSAGRVAARR